MPVEKAVTLFNAVTRACSSLQPLTQEMKLLPAALLLLPFMLHAQYNGPESVEHDAAGQRYFVGNTGSNSIIQRTYGGVVSPFASGLPAAPYGIELKGDTLFACVGSFIRGYRTTDAMEVFALNLGGTFLNGLATDGTYLYVTDFAAKKILKVDVDQQSFSTLVASTGNTPNGIVWDPVQERLWVAGWGSNAQIKSYHRGTGTELSAYTTALGNIDGITLDCQGRIIVASWNPARLTRFEHSFTVAPFTVPSPVLNNPADLDYDAVHERICVPNSGSNTVEFVDVSDCVTAVPEEQQNTHFNIWPNPGTGLMRTDLQLTEASPFLVFNLRGTLVASGTLRPNALLDMSGLSRGGYVLELPRLQRRARFILH